MTNHYATIAKSIQFIKENVKQQPSLDDIAQAVNLSPFHFQKLFKDWAGVSPKKFIQYLTVEHAKSILNSSKATLLETAHNVGLSGTGRLHDLFVTIEGMTPGEFKNHGESLNISYQFYDSLFGNILIASTDKGICHISFSEDDLSILKSTFKNATFTKQDRCFHIDALSVFKNETTDLNQMKLHLKGTEFQLKVWSALLSIPSGHLSTYGALSEDIGSPKAARAVGTAIGSNPIAYIIPCHRVIQQSGNIGGYMWGETRKQIIISWEASQTIKAI